MMRLRGFGHKKKPPGGGPAVVDLATLPEQSLENLARLQQCCAKCREQRPKQGLSCERRATGIRQRDDPSARSRCASARNASGCGASCFVRLLDGFSSSL